MSTDKQGVYFDDPVVGKLADLVLLLSQELYVLRRRNLALEALLVRNGTIDHHGIDTFVPDQDEQLELDRAQGLLDGLWAVLTDDGPAASPLRASWLAQLRHGHPHGDGAPPDADHASE